MGVRAIEIENLSFRRRATGRQILERISLNVEAGEIFCILGPNGAGKSTLIRCLLGLLPAEQGGVVRLVGDDIARLARQEIARRVAYVPQFTQANFAFDVEQMVLLGRAAHLSGLGSPDANDRRIAREALERIGIAGLGRQSFTQLSGGERQLVLIARALAQDTPIIVMDEPTANLDIGNQGRVLELMRELANTGKTVAMTSHMPEQAFNLNCKVGLLKHGQFIAVGGVHQICGADAISALYDAKVRRLDEGGNGTLAAYLPWLA